MAHVGHLTVEIVDVTPELAAEWLANNHQHRPIDPKRVRKYARQMKAGAWALNGKTITFDAQGKLLGGQHRLSACVKSGCTFQTLVVRGLDPVAVLGDKAA